MITIAWDVDDILNDLMSCWLTNEWLTGHPGCNLSFEQITENTPERIISSTKEEYWASLDSFRFSDAYLDMKPNPQVLAWFEKSGSKARHIALTSVPVRAAYISAGWVLKNFGKWIRSFNFVPSLRTGENIPEYDRTKSDYLKWLNNVDLLVEDSQENILQAEKLGIKGLLVKKPWNKSSLLIEDALVEISKIVVSEVV